MDSAPDYDSYSNPEFYSSKELEYLFDVVDDRFNEASEKQTKNKDVAYYGIDVVNETIYYTMTFARSYHRFVTGRADAEVFEVLIPSLIADAEEPVIEQIAGNPEARFMLRKYNKNHEPVYLDISAEGFRGSKKEIVRAYKQFFSNKVEKIDRIMSLAERIRDYELIPSNVPPRYTPVERILRELGIDPNAA